MSRRKQARPKSCKAEDQDCDDPCDVTIKKEMTEDQAVGVQDEAFPKEKETPSNSCHQTNSMIKMEISDSQPRHMTSSPLYNVTPFVSLEPMDVTDGKEMKCEPCGLKFESLDKFIEHRNSVDCCQDKSDFKSSNWLLQETPTLACISPSSQSTNGPDEGSLHGASEDGGVEGEGVSLSNLDLDPNDIPFVIGVTTDNPYGCTFCEKAFAFLAHLHRHEQTHAAQMPYKCAHCPRQFRHQKSRERHEKLHSADRKYRCKVCGVGYSRSDHLRNHMKNHDCANDKGDNPTNKCLLCSLSFSSVTALSNHLKKHKDDEERDSPDSISKTCPECHQEFVSDQEMTQHVCPAIGGEDHSLTQDNQNSVQEWKCPVCSDPFSSMESLWRHLTCHRTVNMDANVATVGAKEASTSSEGGAAATATTATTVFGMEESNKENKVSKPEPQTNASKSASSNPLVCPYCLIEGFESLESLELHLTSVHNVKQTEVYTCNYCNAPYPNLYSLHDHMTVVHRSQHGLDITYPCSMCVQRFHSLDALAKHKGIVHAQHSSTGIDAAFCNRCNMTLSSPKSLEDHMASVHNIIMEKRNTKHNKGKKSTGKQHSTSKAGGITPTHNKSTSSSCNNNNKSSTSKKQQVLFTNSITNDNIKSLNFSSSSPSPTSSTSSSLTTSPALHSSSTVPNTNQSSYGATYGLNESAPASSSSRIKSKKATVLSSGSEKTVESLETIGMTCDHCNATFHDPQNYSAHLLHHTGSLFSSQPFVASLDKAWSSLRTPTAPREVPKPSSTRRTSTSRNDSVSGEASTTDNRHECWECQASFPSNQQLETHVLLHYLRVSTEYACSSCGNNFSKPDQLQRHLMDIHAHHLYRCSLCKDVFDSKVNIQVHFAIKHSDECKLYRCTACDLNFHSEMEWQVHVRVNHLHISRPYRCLFCQESFTSEVELQCHLTTHSKPFVCPMCSQSFHIEYLLDQHMQQTHGDVKPNVTQISPTSSSPTPLSLLIPTTIKQEQELDADASPSNSPHHPLPSLLNRNTSRSIGSNNKILPTIPHSSSSPLPTRTILKSPAASALGKLSQGQGRSSSSSSPRVGGRYIPGTAASGSKGNAAIPGVWKNSEPLHMCNICDIKFNDYNLLMIHKAQDHDLKNVGKVADKSKDEEASTERINLENLLSNIESPLLAINNSSISSSSITPTNGQATPTSSQATSAVTPPSCMFCSQTFKSSVEYEKHMKIHVNSGNLTCSICDETFSSPSVLAEHKLMHCKIQQGNTCVVCRVTLCNKEQFYAHTQEHGFEGTQLQCVVCRQSLSSLVEVQMHGRHHFQANTTHFTCCVCLKSFESRENLVSKLNASGRTYYVCKPCYHGEAPPLHTCSQCSEKFATAQLLDVHMLTHKSSFQCIKCQQSFSSEYEIQLHVATHLMTEGTQHECRLCGCSCDTPARLQTHLIQHSFSGKDITCFVCNKSFESPQEIQVHVLEHSSSYKKYSCSKCPQKFFFTAELENHKLTYNHFSDGIASVTSKPQAPSSSSSSSNFHASALLASLSASPLHAAAELSPSAIPYSKLFAPQAGKSSNKDFSSSPNKHRLSMTSSNNSSATTPKIMKIDTTGKKNGRSIGGALSIPKPGISPSSSSSCSSSSSKRLECPDCHKLFTTGTALANHRKTHLRKEAKNAVKCSLCDEGFPSAIAMQQHFFTTHSGSVKREEEEEEQEEKKPVFECMVCEKSCATLSALQNHILSHRTQSIGSCLKQKEERLNTPGKELECQAMEIKQNHATDKRETEDESGETGSEDTCLLACPVCNQVFLNAEDIDDHIKTHEELFIFQSTEHECPSDPIDKPEEENMEEAGVEEKYELGSQEAEQE